MPLLWGVGVGGQVAARLTYLNTRACAYVNNTACARSEFIPPVRLHLACPEREHAQSTTDIEDEASSAWQTQMDTCPTKRTS